MKGFSLSFLLVEVMDGYNISWTYKLNLRLCRPYLAGYKGFKYIIPKSGGNLT